MYIKPKKYLIDKIDRVQAVSNSILEDYKGTSGRVIMIKDVAILKKRCEEFLEIPLIQALSTEDLPD